MHMHCWDLTFASGQKRGHHRKPLQKERKPLQEKHLLQLQRFLQWGRRAAGGSGALYCRSQSLSE
jgi:hypothetical protein